MTHEFQTNNSSEVSPKTLLRLKDAASSLFAFGSKSDLPGESVGDLWDFADDERGFPAITPATQLEPKDGKPSYMGTGVIPVFGGDYVVWTQVEGGLPASIDLNGEVVEPVTVIREDLGDYHDLPFGTVPIKFVIVTRDSRVFEIDESYNKDEEYEKLEADENYVNLDMPVVKELGEAEAVKHINSLREAEKLLKSDAQAERDYQKSL